MKQSLWTLVLIVAAAIVVRYAWPRTVAGPPSAPRIITVYDTVEAIDTVWVEEIRTVIRQQTDTVNLIERVTITVPETLVVVPRLAGLTALQVPQAFGDSALAHGFEIVPLDTGYTQRFWQAQYFVTGPLQGVVVDSIPPAVSFWPMPEERGCDFWCALPKYALGVVIGFASGKVF